VSSCITAGKSQQFPIVDIESAFKICKPAPPLSAHVESLWIYKGIAAGGGTERILPTGTLELVINLRQDHLSFHDPDRAGRVSRFSGAIISGAHGCGLIPRNPDQIFLIGAHFKPGGAFPFLGLPAVEFADTHADLASVWGSSADPLRERLCEAKTSEQQFHILEHALLQRLRRDVEKHYAVQAALEIFERNTEGTKISETAKYVGLSQRRFIQAFKTEVGLTPKLFSRIQRFQRARITIQRTSTPDWPGLALDLGYFDQSHLIREFVEFSGLSPTDYLTRQTELLRNWRPGERDNHPQNS
jgi:AraC-like DNA-binding protein